MVYSIGKPGSPAEFRVPAAPLIREQYRRALRRRIIGAVLIRMILIATVAFALLLRLSPLFAEYFPAPSEPADVEMGSAVDVVTGLLALVSMTPLLLEVMSVNVILVHAAGIAVPGMTTVTGNHLRPLGGLGSLNLGLTFVSFAIGILLGLTGALLVFPAHSPLAIGIAVAAAVAGLFFGCRLLIRASRSWKSAMRRLEVAATARAAGRHSIATATEVEQRDLWIGDRPTFLVRTRASPAEPDAETTGIRFLWADYSCWAPMIGNEFDVWSDPAHPDDYDRIVIERRMSGQKFPTDPSSFLRPGTNDGTAPGRTQPRWASDLREVPRSRAALYVSISMTLLLVALACGWIAWSLLSSLFESLPWWLPAALAIAGVSIVAAAFGVLRPLVRPVATTRVAPGSEIALAVSLIGYLAMLVAVVGAFWAFGAAEWTFPVDSVEDAEAFEGRFHLALTALIAECVILLFASMPPALGGTLTPPRNASGVTPEQVREAAHSGDDTGIARLKREFGFIVGPEHVD